MKVCGAAFTILQGFGGDFVEGVWCGWRGVGQNLQFVVAKAKGDGICFKGEGF